MVNSNMIQEEYFNSRVCLHNIIQKSERDASLWIPSYKWCRILLCVSDPKRLGTSVCATGSSSLRRHNTRAHLPNFHRRQMPALYLRSAWRRDRKNWYECGKRLEPEVISYSTFLHLSRTPIIILSASGGHKFASEHPKKSCSLALTEGEAHFSANAKERRTILQNSLNNL